MDAFEPIRQLVQSAREALEPLGLEVIGFQPSMHGETGIITLQAYVVAPPAPGPSPEELAEKARVDAEFEAIAESMRATEVEEKRRLLAEELRKREEELG